MAREHIPLFSVTLRGGESIGPGPLLVMWAQASGVASACVSRTQPAERSRPLYTLWGPPWLAELGRVEDRLREQMRAARLHPTITVLHHGALH